MYTDSLISSPAFNTPRGKGDLVNIHCSTTFLYCGSLKYCRTLMQYPAILPSHSTNITWGSVNRLVPRPAFNTPRRKGGLVNIHCSTCNIFVLQLIKIQPHTCAISSHITDRWWWSMSHIFLACIYTFVCVFVCSEAEWWSDGDRHPERVWPVHEYCDGWHNRRTVQHTEVQDWHGGRWSVRECVCVWGGWVGGCMCD